MTKKIGVASWVEETRRKSEEAAKEGKKLINEEGVRTKEQSSNIMFEYPWQMHDPDSKEREKSVSSIKVNEFTKEVLTYLSKETMVSERKRITSIVESAMRDIAGKIENGKFK
ncbi:hypothetical protein ACE1BH_17390 [Aeromonas jandaei]